ncbi:MAG: cell division protein FtsA [Bacteroidota bacterium]|jgi:cell division protein FtsA
MENSPIVVGLDIGTTKICTIVGRKNEHGKIDILGYGKAESLGVSRGVVTNIGLTIDSIRKSLQEASAKSGVDIARVFVGIAGQHIKSLQHHGMVTRRSGDDEITQENIDAIVTDMLKLAMPPGEQIIHVIPQEYIVDSESGIKNPIGMAGVRLEANCHIITGQVTAVKNINRCVQQSGLSIEGLFLEPLASADAVLSGDEKEAGVCLVDIGGGTTDIAIFQDGVIRHTAVIPFGGNVITEDIKEGCSILKNQAEKLKIKFGSALSSPDQDNEIVAIPSLRGRPPREIRVRTLSSIIQARMEEIIDYVFYEIVHSGYEKKLIEGIVVTGGGALLKHLPQLIEYRTGKDTRIGYPNEHLAKGADEVKSPMFATAVGLVIKGYQELERQKRTGPVEETQQKPKESRKDKIAQPNSDMEGRWFDSLKKFFTEEEEDTKLR